MNSMEFLKNEILRLQVHLIEILQKESSIRSTKEIIQKELQNYQCLIDNFESSHLIINRKEYLS